ncbi:hypothetical protein JMJ35_009131 [Cladonia borealis]|uniref:Rhodopsin domain-containing protein n=1 Tax=Cladonia borealis TaxID=184061 RepID=A0AA39QTG0_9LECA|nr:hypothetical protein JMJ35_009131 [Cladonia borealis]
MNSHIKSVRSNESDASVDDWYGVFFYKRDAIRVSALALWFYALLGVCLRFLARRLSKAGFWYDDWLLIPAFLSATVMCYMSGHTLNEDTDHKLYVTDYYKTIFAMGTCWIVAVSFAKYSILALYWRLFSSVKSVRIGIYVLLAIVTIWLLAFIFPFIFQCSPVNKYWNFQEQGLCMSMRDDLLVLWSSISHFIIDMAILILPVPTVCKLQMSWPRKAMLFLVFAQGGFVTIVIVIRMVYSVRIFDQGQNIAAVIVWANVEVDVAIACACLPLLRPIVSMVTDRLASWRKDSNQQKDGIALQLVSPPQRFRLKHPWSHNRSLMSDVSRSVSPATYDPPPRELEAV